MVLPGFGADDTSTFVLRRFLERLGYRVQGWGLGRNTGNLRQLLPKAVERVRAFAEQSEAPVRLVGWSLGGYLAREIARLLPEQVDRVITLGSPVLGGPRYTIFADAYARHGHDLAALEAALQQREQVPIPVPVVAIYSRTDGIVHWQACIDRENPHVEHVEVGASHLGMGFAPEVFEVIAQRLHDPIGPATA